MNRNRGVTLIELLISVALGFILIMLAVPAYTTWTSEAEASSAASSIADGLRSASAEAIKQNTPVEFVLSAGGWVARLASTGTTVKHGYFGEGANRATFVTDPASTNTVTFNALGGAEVKNADTSDRVDYVNVVVAGSARQLRVLVGATRNGIRVCDRKYSWPSDPKGCP